jgi:hypothetical protein
MAVCRASSLGKSRADGMGRRAARRRAAVAALRVAAPSSHSSSGEAVPGWEKDTAGGPRGGGDSGDNREAAGGMPRAPPNGTN